MWNMIKRAGDRSETDVSSSTLFLFSTKLSAQTFSLSSILFFSLPFHRSSSRFHSASTIVITLFRLTSSKFLETSNDNDGGEGGKGGRGKRRENERSSFAEKSFDSAFRISLKIDGERARGPRTRISSPTTARSLFVYLFTHV